MISKINIFNLKNEESGLGKDWVYLWVEHKENSGRWWRDFWIVDTIGM